MSESMNVVRELLGAERVVFDNLAWAQAGYDHPDGNEQFWRRATIERVLFNRSGEYTADVRFHHDNRLSNGHFIEGMRLVPVEDSGVINRGLRDA